MKIHGEVVGLRASLRELKLPIEYTSISRTATTSDDVFPRRVRCWGRSVWRSLLRVLQSDAVENCPAPHRPPLPF